MTYVNKDGAFAEFVEERYVADKVLVDFDPAPYQEKSSALPTQQEYLALTRGSGVHIVGIATNDWAYGYDASNAKLSGWFPTSHVSFLCHARFQFNAVVYGDGFVDLCKGEEMWLQRVNADGWMFVSKEGSATGCVTG